MTSTSTGSARNITVKSLSELAAKLRKTRRALKRDWAVFGGSSTELTQLLAAGSGSATGSEDSKNALTALSAPLQLGINTVCDLRQQLSTDLQSYISTHTASEVETALAQYTRALRTAVELHRDQQVRGQQLEYAQQLRVNAAKTGRSLTAAEGTIIYQLETGLNEPVDGETTANNRITDGVDNELVVATIGALRLRAARKQLRDGLLVTAQMRELISEALPAIHSGSPILLLGETGGAKTALAEHLSKLSGKTAEFVSGHGDITAAQLIGAHELRSEQGATVTVFSIGPLLRAMSEGKPLILDEINAMPAEFLKRLNRILQLRPGDKYVVQEQAGLTIEISPGFAIIATANEHAPHRYRGIEQLSAELVNRFGANTFRVRYPDAGRSYAEYPHENALLAAAALADAEGKLPGGCTPELVERIARVAFISQQVFAGNRGEGFARYITTELDFDEQPGLDEVVIAPRTLVALLEKVVQRASSENFADQLNSVFVRFIDGVMHREDRRVLTLIMQGQGFNL